MKITFTGYRQTATLATLAFVTTLAGCTMAPKHERPPIADCDGLSLRNVNRFWRAGCR